MAIAINKANSLRKVVSSNSLLDNANNSSVKEITSESTKLEVVFRRTSNNSHLEDWQNFFNEICQGLIDEIS